ncbi:MAG: nucleotide exchange factor GrpE [bacterium]|nr:nucleotide exchange factor GrpE [bacterium]
MGEEKEVNNFGCKYAIFGVSALIFNEEGKLFLAKSPKWKNLWMVPGGKVEFGESMSEALEREVKEETGLSIKDIKYLNTVELNRTEERPNMHMVVMRHVTKTSDSEVKLNDEHSKFDWRAPEDWLKEKDIHPSIKETIEYYLNEFLSKNDHEGLYKRALADYQNLLKQTAKEKMEFAMFANEIMLREILPVYDHLKMAIEHHNEESKDEWLAGVKHVVKQFKDVLEKIGVTEIKTAGEKFDHNSMEAIKNEETADEKLDGQVAKQMKAGYKLNGKVIEAAKVVVYKVK